MLSPVHSFREAAQAAGLIVKSISEVDASLPASNEQHVLVAVNQYSGVVHGGFNEFHDQGMSWFLETSGRGFNFNRPQDRDAFYARCI